MKSKKRRIELIVVVMLAVVFLASVVMGLCTLGGKSKALELCHIICKIVEGCW
ncbi:MAG: hypothetical protein FWD76_01010 [Firmicutes bacterium]|nr:hypothetical protein [Bacillota bacterium]